MRHTLAMVLLAGLATLSGACGGEGTTGATTEGTGTAQQEYRVFNTGGEGLIVRSCPSTGCDRISGLLEGAVVDIVCQTIGQQVSNGAFASVIWDELAGGGFVSDVYVDTPIAHGFAPDIPRCIE